LREGCLAIIPNLCKPIGAVGAAGLGNPAPAPIEVPIIGSLSFKREGLGEMGEVAGAAE